MDLHRTPATIFLAFSAAAAAETIYVPAEFPTIQMAVDNTEDGDIVIVSEGTYFENIDLGSRRITLRSAQGPARTVINGLRKSAVVTIGPGSDRTSILAGFTVTNGYAPTDGNAGGIEVIGGGPSIIGNIVSGNFGGCRGSGISLDFSSALLFRNIIRENSNPPDSISGGGGGGGIGAVGNPCGEQDCEIEIRENIIQRNITNNCTFGGGIYLNAAGAVRIASNLIAGNSAFSGAGIAIFNRSEVVAENNLIADNTAVESGGGIYWLTPSAAKPPRLVGNTLVNNSAAKGSAVLSDGYAFSGRIVNNTIVGGGATEGLVTCGLFFGKSSAPMIWNNNVYSDEGAAFSGFCSDVLGDDGNISVAPTFLDLSDYRLARTSAGIDAGENAFASETSDRLGGPRVIDADDDGLSTVDMGAYELSDYIFAEQFDTLAPAGSLP